MLSEPDDKENRHKKLVRYKMNFVSNDSLFFDQSVTESLGNSVGENGVTDRTPLENLSGLDYFPKFKDLLIRSIVSMGDYTPIKKRIEGKYFLQLNKEYNAII